MQWWRFKPTWMDKRQVWRTGVEWKEKICLAQTNNGFSLQCPMGTLNSWAKLIATHEPSLTSWKRETSTFLQQCNNAQVLKVEIAGWPLTLSSLPIVKHFLVWHPAAAWLHISQHHYHGALTASHHLPPLRFPWLYHLLLQYFFHSRLANCAMSLPY